MVADEIISRADALKVCRLCDTSRTLTNPNLTLPASPTLILTQVAADKAKLEKQVA